MIKLKHVSLTIYIIIKIIILLVVYIIVKIFNDLLILLKFNIVDY
jgi:hypothetical protein